VAVGAGVAVAVGGAGVEVAVGGTGVAVGGTGVAVGGIGVAVGAVVAVGGADVAVAGAAVAATRAISVGWAGAGAEPHAATNSARMSRVGTSVKRIGREVLDGRLMVIGYRLREMR
jgi:hypothetical protein